MSGVDGSHDNGAAGEPTLRQRNMRDTPELSRQGRAKRRRLSEKLLVGFSQSAGEINFRLKEMPENRGGNGSCSLLAQSQHSGHSAMLHCYKQQIKRHYTQSATLY